MINKIIKLFINPQYRFLVLSKKGFYNNQPDDKFLKKKYKFTVDRELNLKNPSTYNEKLQWLKLYDRRPEYTTMVDKVEVKKYVAEKIGEEYLIPTLGVWETADEVDFDSLPDKFVIKCNHNSGLGMSICKDKSTFDVEKARAELKKGLKQDYYLTSREWPYKNVKRKIIAEQYMEDAKTSELRDYKFFCFNGKVRCFKIDFDRFTAHRANYYNENGDILLGGEVICPPDFNKQLKMPRQIDRMFELSEKLSEGIPFLRVDFYEVNEKVYFGELTFFPSAGFGIFEPEEWDYKFGEWLTLPNKTIEK